MVTLENWLSYIALVAALGIGWWMGRRERTKSSDTLGPNYYQGLNYLLNEEPDRAVAPFIEDLEVNSDTLETHLALGSLLRRRGELEKAVIVHENILTNAKLEKDVMLNVQLELARDYLLAGLLDRAEDLLLKLSQEEGHVRREGLKLMLEIYEQEKEWYRAVEIGELLAIGEDTEKYERSISHYCCEIAEDLLKLGHTDEAREAISDGIGHDANNARMSLVLGKLELAEKQYVEAIRALQRIKDQDPVYVPESLEPLLAAYQQGVGSLADFRQYLFDCLETTPSISIVLMLATHIRDEDGDEAVAKFIANHLKKNPTIRGLTQLIDLHIDNAHGVSKQNLSILRSFAEALVANKPAYRCQNCGFDGKKMRWHCPSCKEWGTVQPIFGLEGE
ncbi:MAG TPA: lipopolysaccharide assembly protein LapB [Gammaproteobacteria bacterium]|nr:lipopolysaccharide assembly protein LapB [Gammaproteobacteria bacterium]HIL96220.1 lipopolysaccharide assembly protein LapB [Pseudomonadales bacterium]